MKNILRQRNCLILAEGQTNLVGGIDDRGVVVRKGDPTDAVFLAVQRLDGLP